MISKKAPIYGQGLRLGEDWYEGLPGLPLSFYDDASARREFEPYGLVELSEINQPSEGGGTLPFINIMLRARDAAEPVDDRGGGSRETTTSPSSAGSRRARSVGVFVSGRK